MDWLKAAFREVAATPSSMTKLARAAMTRPNIEREWVYELDGTNVLSSPALRRRESRLGPGATADLLLDGTFIEFKSTMAHYAVKKAFDPAYATSKFSAYTWLTGDLTRMAAADGIFVLLVSTPRVPVSGEFKDFDRAKLRSYALDQYEAWLQTFGSTLGKDVPLVEHCEGGQGEYDGNAVRHDALIVYWS